MKIMSHLAVALQRGSNSFQQCSQAHYHRHHRPALNSKPPFLQINMFLCKEWLSKGNRKWTLSGSQLIKAPALVSFTWCFVKVTPSWFTKIGSLTLALRLKFDSLKRRIRWYEYDEVVDFFRKCVTKRNHHKINQVAHKNHLIESRIIQDRLCYRVKCNKR